MAVGSTQQSVVRPARGTRPSNRRQLIIDAATDLFSRKGYANVAMGDVAEAVAIGPSALYRHFRGKQDLLATVVEAALATLDDAFTAAEDERLSDVSQALAAAGFDAGAKEVREFAVELVEVDQADTTVVRNRRRDQASAIVKRWVRSTLPTA